MSGDQTRSGYPGWLIGVRKQTVCFPPHIPVFRSRRSERRFPALYDAVRLRHAPVPRTTEAIHTLTPLCQIHSGSKNSIALRYPTVDGPSQSSEHAHESPASARQSLCVDIWNQPERDENGEGRKRAEKGQKMAEGTKLARNFLCDIKMLGWMGFLDARRTMCVVPNEDFRRILEQVRTIDLAA
jgi:hypothetical protein